MGGIGSALQLLHGLGSLTLCSWTTFLECWRSSGGAYSFKGRKELVRKGMIHIFDGDQLAENPLITIFLTPLVKYAMVVLFNDLTPADLGFLELGLSLIRISFGSSGSHDFPILRRVGDLYAVQLSPVHLWMPSR